MRKLVLLGVAIGLLTTASTASAQGSGSWIGSLGGGVSLPVGNFGDASKTGWHGAAALGYKPADSKMEYLVDASYHHLVNKSYSDAHSNLFVALARANYWTGSKLYVIGGAGVMRDEFSVTTLGVTSKSSSSAFALTGGLGIALNKTVFVEARVLNGFTKGSSTTLVPLTIGVKF